MKRKDTKLDMERSGEHIRPRSEKEWSINLIPSLHSPEENEQSTAHRIPLSELENGRLLTILPGLTLRIMCFVHYSAHELLILQVGSCFDLRVAPVTTTLYPTTKVLIFPFKMIQISQTSNLAICR